MRILLTESGLYLADKFVDREERLALHPTQGSSLGRQQRAPFGQDDLPLLQVHVVDERLAEGRDEVERPATEEDRSPQVATMRQGHHGLHRYGPEDGGCNIGLGDVFGNKVLYVGLAEDATTRRNRIDLCALQG